MLHPAVKTHVLDSSRTVTAADDSDAFVIGHSFGYTARTGSERRHFKDTIGPFQTMVLQFFKVSAYSCAVLGPISRAIHSGLS